jgi:conjugative transfer signal peptidase TraF
MFEQKRSPYVIFNQSESVPSGFYWLRRSLNLSHDDIVLIDPPSSWTRIAVERGYLALETPMLKVVAGKSGDVVCRDGLDVSINGEQKARAKLADRRNRPMPRWRACIRLKHDQLFLLGVHHDSFDGRYMGVIANKHVIGIATKF